MADAKVDPLSFEGLIAADAKLLAKPLDVERYRKLASAETIEKTRAALAEKKFSVEVVQTKAEALAAVQKQLDPTKSFYMTGSHSTAEIGFNDWIKANPAAIGRNIKEEAATAMAKGDWGAAGIANAAGANADVIVTTPVALTEDGSMLVACTSGTRSGCWGPYGGKLVVIVGANKIESDMKAAHKRLNEWAQPLVDAWTRLAYAALGIPGSPVTYTVENHSVNAYGANRHHIIIVNDVLGF